MGDEGADRRKDVRVPTNIEVDYASENTFLFAYITDISSMGIFIKTDKPLEVGAPLQLRFTAPADVQQRMDDEPTGPLDLQGEVVWNTKASQNRGHPGMGVKFTSLEPAQRSRLLDLVRAIAYLDDREGN